jgi:hypothetical protein
VGVQGCRGGGAGVGVQGCRGGGSGEPEGQLRGDEELGDGEGLGGVTEEVRACMGVGVRGCR